MSESQGSDDAAPSPPACVLRAFVLSDYGDTHYFESDTVLFLPEEQGHKLMTFYAKIQNAFTSEARHAASSRESSDKMRAERLADVVNVVQQILGSFPHWSNVDGDDDVQWCALDFELP